MGERMRATEAPAILYTNNPLQSCPTLQPLAHWFSEFRRALPARGGLTLPAARYSCAATSSAAVLQGRLDALAALADGLAAIAQGVTCGDYETDQNAARFSYCENIYARLSRQAERVTDATRAARAYAGSAALVLDRASPPAPALTGAAHAAEWTVWAANALVSLIRIAPLSDAERDEPLTAVMRLLDAYLSGTESA